MRLKTLLVILSFLTIILLGWWFFSFEIPNPKFHPLNIPQKEDNITLIAVGDIMLSRTVEQKMIQQNDWLYPFRETYQVTTNGDIVFGNLESPIIEGRIINTGEMVFRTDPKSVAGLQFGGFNVLSLANNHLKNFGAEGIKKTIEYLDQAGIQHSGAGLNLEEARKPAILEVKGKKFGFLSYVDNSFTPDSYEATTSRAGSPFLNSQTLIEDIEKLRNQVDIVVVSMHAGTEYSPKPNQKQIDFAHLAIDNGATLVIGHHPHVVQPVEQYNNGYILYSLGNFIFDQMWSEETREGAMAKITFSKNKIEDVEFIPLKIYDFAQPRVLSTNEGQNIRERMAHFTF